MGAGCAEEFEVNILPDTSNVLSNRGKYGGPG